jgi:hypothetical protein
VSIPRADRSDLSVHPALDRPSLRAYCRTNELAISRAAVDEGV